MMTSKNENIFRVTGHLCGEFTGHTGEFPEQKPLTRTLDIFFDLRLNKRLSKQSLGWWFETPSHPLCRHCNVTMIYHEHLKQWNMSCLIPLRFNGRIGSITTTESVKLQHETLVLFSPVWYFMEFGG